MGQLHFLPSTHRSSFHSFRREFPGLAVELSASFRPGISLARAELFTKSNGPRRKRNASLKFKVEKSSQCRRDLQSLSDLLRQQQTQVEDSHPANDNPSPSSTDSPSRASQRSRGFSALQAEVWSRKDVVPGRGKKPPFLNPPANLKQGAKSTSTPGLQSSDAEKKLSGTFDGERDNSLQSTRRRGNRSSKRGFDALDDVMLLQGRTSRALLESLQAEVASERDAMLNFVTHFPEDAQMGSFANRNADGGEHTEGKHGGTSSQMLADSRRVQRWQPVDEDAPGSVSTSYTFTRSIEKALSPSVAAKTSSATKANPSDRKIVQQQSTQSSQRDGSSDMAQPGLRGQEVIWALQKAAIEKAKQKQKNRKPNDRDRRGKEIASSNDVADWRNAKPIVLRSEWALEIADLEQRIDQLKNPLPLS